MKTRTKIHRMLTELDEAGPRLLGRTVQTCSDRGYWDAYRLQGHLGRLRMRSDARLIRRIQLLKAALVADGVTEERAAAWVLTVDGLTRGPKSPLAVEFWRGTEDANGDWASQMRVRRSIAFWRERDNPLLRALLDFDVTVDEAATFNRVDPRTIRRWCREWERAGKARWAVGGWLIGGRAALAGMPSINPLAAELGIREYHRVRIERKKQPQ